MFYVDESYVPIIFYFLMLVTLIGQRQFINFYIRKKYFITIVQMKWPNLIYFNLYLIHFLNYYSLLFQGEKDNGKNCILSCEKRKADDTDLNKDLKKVRRHFEFDNEEF